MSSIPLTKPVLGTDEIDRVAHVLRSGSLVQSTRVAAFESGVAQLLGGERHTIAVSSGTDAIQIAMMASDISVGDEVIVPDFCFPSVASAVIRTGAVPVLCDVVPSTFNMDSASVERAMSPKTKAILAVHQFGIPCNVPAIQDLFSGLVIEDAACALGARDEGGLCGTQSLLGCFSFHPRKIITTGEGGMITTSSAELAERSRWLRAHGMQRTSNGVEFSEVGLSSRMTDIHAAVGLAQLDRFEDIVAGRARAAQVYREALQGVAGVVESPQIWSDNRVYQGLVLLLDPSVDRDRTVRHLRENKIESTIGTYAIHRQLPIARHCRVASGGLAGSLSAFRSSITLPLWPDMPSAAIDRVVETLKQVLVS